MEELAKAQLAAIATEEVAGEVAWAVDDLQWEDLGSRVGDAGEDAVSQLADDAVRALQQAGLV